MPIPSDLTKKIRVDFYRICTGIELADYADMPWRFRQALELIEERSMRVACIRFHLQSKAAKSCQSIANRYGVTSQNVSKLRRRRADEA